MTRNNPYLAGVMNANQVAQDRAHSAEIAALKALLEEHGINTEPSGGMKP